MDEEKKNSGNVDIGEELEDIKSALEDVNEASDEAAGTTDGADKEDDKSSDKSAKKDPKDEAIKELKDKFTRQMAEFDNFRKRTEKEKSAMYEVGAKSVIEKILPIVDNFERGLGSVTEEDKGSAFVEGMNMVYRQLTKALEDMDVKPIEALGKEFNPEYHNAVMHVDDEEAGDNIIVEEFQKGYTYRDSVVRHSMVKVAN